MNMWVVKGQGVTAEKLLGPEFFGKDAKGFKTQEEWDEHKRDVTEMARKHSKIFRQIQAGKRKTESATFEGLRSLAAGAKK